eukprot:6174075-Pleurochrysis_carterae.AAC.1
MTINKSYGQTLSERLLCALRARRHIKAVDNEHTSANVVYKEVFAPKEPSDLTLTEATGANKGTADQFDNVLPDSLPILDNSLQSSTAMCVLGRAKLGYFRLDGRARLSYAPFNHTSWFWPSASCLALACFTFSHAY